MKADQALKKGAATSHVGFYLQSLALVLLLHAAACFANVAVQVTSFSFGKNEEPQGGVNFWHKCSALRHLDPSEGM